MVALKRNNEKAWSIQKVTPALVFSCELSEILRTAFLRNTYERLLPSRQKDIYKMS